MAEADLFISIHSNSSESDAEDTRQQAYPQYDRRIVEQYESISLNILVVGQACIGKTTLLQMITCYWPPVPYTHLTLPTNRKG